MADFNAIVPDESTIDKKFLQKLKSKDLKKINGGIDITPQNVGGILTFFNSMSNATTQIMNPIGNTLDNLAKKIEHKKSFNAMMDIMANKGDLGEYAKAYSDYCGTTVTSEELYGLYEQIGNDMNKWDSTMFAYKESIVAN